MINWGLSGKVNTKEETEKNTKIKSNEAGAVLLAIKDF